LFENFELKREKRNKRREQGDREKELIISERRCTSASTKLKKTRRKKRDNDSARFLFA
jgi:hypothetical protein